MIDFPDALLEPLPGEILHLSADRPGPDAGTWSVDIPLRPFSADDVHDLATFRPGTAGPKLIETSISLDMVDLPGTGLDELSGRTFVFPVNPEPGFIDGSVYLFGTHNAVDVTRIEFGRPEDGAIGAVLDAFVEFGDTITGIRDRTAVIATSLRFRRVD